MITGVTGVTGGVLWLWVVTICYGWLELIMGGYDWLQLVTGCKKWLRVVMGG